MWLCYLCSKTKFKFCSWHKINLRYESTVENFVNLLLYNEIHCTLDNVDICRLSSIIFSSHFMSIINKLLFHVLSNRLQFILYIHSRNVYRNAYKHTPSKRKALISSAMAPKKNMSFHYINEIEYKIDFLF